MTTRPYPLDTEARRAARAANLASYLKAAEVNAHKANLSMKCEGYGSRLNPLHSDHPGGCKNDGTGCLCECHDQITSGVSLLPPASGVA
jgi:hypothetical protein